MMVRKAPNFLGAFLYIGKGEKMIKNGVYTIKNKGIKLTPKSIDILKIKDELINMLGGE